MCFRGLGPIPFPQAGSHPADWRNGLGRRFFCRLHRCFWPTCWRSPWGFMLQCEMAGLTNESLVHYCTCFIPPSFVAALFLLSLFAVRLAGTPFELPLFGMYSDRFHELSFFSKVLGHVMRHMFLPVLCFTYRELWLISAAL